MTCRHALDLIDADEFVASAPGHWTALREHAAVCAACGAALASAPGLTSELKTLAQVPAPKALASRVMARIDRLEAEGLGVAASRGRDAAPARRDWSMLAPLGGLTAGLALLLSGDAPIDVMLAPRAGLLDPAAMPVTAFGALGVVLGLSLYLVSVLRPEGKNRQS